MTTDLRSAARLARQGRHDEARVMLDELGGRTSDNPVLLDLLARVHAQQGELAIADECWARAEEVGGDLPAARDGRRRIAALQARRYRPVARRAAGAAAVVVVLAGAGATGALLARQDNQTEPAPAPAPPPAAQPDTRAQDDLARRVDEVSAQLDQVLARTKVIDELSAALGGSGLLVTRSQDTLTVAFPVGLFSSGTNLSEAGRRALTDIGQRLAQFGGRVTITVVGHTDNGRISPRSRFADHVDLGVARARVAAQQLSPDAGVPLTGFALTSTGMAEPPFPNTTIEDRARNRTVTLRLSPN